MSVASTTGVWADIDPREAASRGATLAAEHGGLIPFPLMCSPAAGGTRWAADALGFATSLLPGLPTDIGPAGWRLLGARAVTAARTRDAGREESRRGRTLDAVAEYAESSGLHILVSVPGPWTLVRRLGLPDGAPALGDAGARRDIIQSYAHGLQELRETLARTVAEPAASPAEVVRAAADAAGQPGRADSAGGLITLAEAGRTAAAEATDPLSLVRFRLVEDDLDPILTGRVPTVSGYRTLAAVADAHVVAALRSVTQRTGADTILSLPTAAIIRIAGKDIAHTALAADAGITQLSVPLAAGQQHDRPTAHHQTALGQAGDRLAGGDWDLGGGQDFTGAAGAARLRAWERLAAWTESGGGLWLRVPASAADAPEAVRSWVDAVAGPWTGVGMARSGLADFGILTGEELPTGSSPLLPEPASGQRSRIHVRMAAALARAFADQAG